MCELSASDKEFLIRAYDYRAFSRSGEFRDPAARRVRRLERLYLRLQRINQREPINHEQRIMVAKRLFRKPVVVDAPPLMAWRALQAEAQAAFNHEYQQVKTFIEQHVYTDKHLLRELDKHRRQQETRHLADEQIAQQRAVQDRKEAEQEKAEKVAQADDARKWRRNESDRVRRLNKEQNDFHDHLERKDRRWRDSMG